MSGKFTLQIVSDQRFVNDKFVSGKLNIQLPPNTPLPTRPIRHLHISHNAPYLPPLNLHNLCFSFLLGITAVLREIENNAYAKFWGQIGCNMGDMQVEFTYQLHLRLTSVFWSITFKTAAPQNVTNNTSRKKISKYECTISFTTST